MDETVRELLKNVRVAAPCSESWNDMPGSDSVRSCERCQHKVYNLSEMTAPEAADLLRRAEGRLCVRFYRRADGTVMTKDCPVGAQAATRARRRRFGMIGLSMASVAGVAGAGLSAHHNNEHHEPMLGRVQAVRVEPIDTPTPEPQPVMGAMAVPVATPTPEAVMGTPMIASTETMGKVARPVPSDDKPYLHDMPAETTTPREDPFKSVKSGDK